MISKPQQLRPQPGCWRHVVPIGALLVLAGCLDPTTGEWSTDEQPIIGGTETSDWPAVGCYLMLTGGLCTATLVHPDVLLTAAHCAENGGPGDWWTTDPDLDDNIPGDWYQIAEVHVHPQHEQVEWWHAHDMAVLILEEPITEFDYIPINLENIDHTWGEKWLRHVGYGSDTTYGGPGSGVKREVDIQLYDIYPETFMTYTAGANHCSGDSGGPAFVEQDGRWYQAGVVSGGWSWSEGMDICTGVGLSMRADYEVDFLAEYFDPHETPYPADDDVDDTVDEADDDTAEEATGCECSATQGGGLVRPGAVLVLLVAFLLARRRAVGGAERGQDHLPTTSLLAMLGAFTIATIGSAHEPLPQYHVEGPLPHDLTHLPVTIPPLSGPDRAAYDSVVGVPALARVVPEMIVLVEAPGPPDERLRSAWAAVEAKMRALDESGRKDDESTSGLLPLDNRLRASFYETLAGKIACANDASTKRRSKALLALRAMATSPHPLGFQPEDEELGWTLGVEQQVLATIDARLEQVAGR